MHGINQTNGASNHPTDKTDDRGWCLCLSGGGFRATLFHLGVLTRLNELGVLSQLSTITSVSGGSILNGLLASRWSQLAQNSNGTFSNWQEVVAEPMRVFCSKDLRTRILLGTRLYPPSWPAVIRDGFSVSANFLARGYQPFFNARLSDLPLPAVGKPRFIFCATNVRTGACWHFHTGPQARMGDFYTGYCDATDVSVAEAVAASSAFPPGFSALRLRLPRNLVFSRIDPWGEERVKSTKRPDDQDMTKDVILLTDGGVYDNLAVEPVWNRYKTLLVSDAGSPFDSSQKCGQGILARLTRAANISMEQVGAVRERWLVNDFSAGRRTGAIWSLNTRIEEFPISDSFGFGSEARNVIQRIRTDLNAFDEAEIACLENHGYSLADVALRSYAPKVCLNASAAFHWPHGNWSDDQKAVKALAKSHKRQIFRDLFRYMTLRT